MSLSNLLASIGDSSDPAAPAPAKEASTSAMKRKADGELAHGPAKRPTTPSNGYNGSIGRPVSVPANRNGTAAKPKPPASATNAEYKSSAKPPAPPVVKKTDSKALVKPSNISTTTQAAKQATGPTTPTTTSTPKPGSLAARLAAAAARQEAQKNQPVGGFVHKKTEAISKKERMKLKDLTLRDKKQQGVRSRTGSSEATIKPDVKKKPIVEKSTYLGSVKPTKPTYNGSLGAPRPNAAKRGKAKHDAYADWSDLSDAEDEEADYESDLSDMEAGAFDVEREEELALKAAKKDDAEELALEERLRREKQARLAKLAAGAAKKKSVY